MKANFVSIFCEVLSKASLPAQLQEDFLHAVAKAVKATTAQQLAMGLGLAQCTDTTLRAEGAKFLRTRLNELTAPPGSRDAVASLPDDLAHALVFFLERQEGFAKQRVALMKLLQHSAFLLPLHAAPPVCSPPLANRRRRVRLGRHPASPPQCMRVSQLHGR